ncbi:DNA-binding MarR family transcriptional regulator [Clostridium acetobutylicum]|uniref:Transcriptional regulator, MarR/EmrR family n=1 Tax=Clostridium acetobutylicum (strain ATCC 824 / DSM 792 / JCM 1419 / IAM 19013 / LMG 5710 / NBRC 13948 / NRRL B-527 / VKM B-1787 / 2291 / W) TaxID=272562 RepID=Q97J21_CLOAB|nr:MULTISPECIES: MarR family transcriptional regulator [Clostridium]AAK79433.1 Transcriptional regulator, MarR/EmrR family [Clostridium acetobutylicum ATCC 824]ADZ20518.1 Transcriptional regulator, MarR/EmrR family [Clostridium acetobutylicum EA 2018]AEI31823.1 MarR family transcriptional regulator [Clostridium acetobutylicum DSM 1731]AWV81320.1 MarR family transcriptional regulator [Clostridium acetobutylicum]MBC2392954.1 MarR family transcriptional regulator [Clostridium acetobutylicum]
MPKKELEEYYVPFQCMIISNINSFNIDGVTTAQYNTLDILDKQGSKTTKELAEIRGISQAGISKLTKRLLEKGYVTQERRKTDRRNYDIIITESGKDFLIRSEKFRNKIMNLIENTLTERELDCFLKLCKKITDSYEEK